MEGRKSDTTFKLPLSWFECFLLCTWFMNLQTIGWSPTRKEEELTFFKRKWKFFDVLFKGREWSNKWFVKKILLFLPSSFRSSTKYCAPWIFHALIHFSLSPLFLNWILDEGWRRECHFGWFEGFPTLLSPLWIWEILHHAMKSERNE